LDLEMSPILVLLLYFAMEPEVLSDGL
jgi:hypothetical protein